jgi:hypothetical protein
MYLRVYNDSTSLKLRHGDLYGDCWIVNWKHRRKLSWPNITFYPGICPEGLNKTKLRMDNPSSGINLNTGLPKQEAGFLPIRMRLSFFFFCIDNKTQFSYMSLTNLSLLNDFGTNIPWSVRELLPHYHDYLVYAPSRSSNLFSNVLGTTLPISNFDSNLLFSDGPWTGRYSCPIFTKSSIKSLFSGIWRSIVR